MLRVGGDKAGDRVEVLPVCLQGVGRGLAGRAVCEECAKPGGTFGIGAARTGGGVRLVAVIVVMRESKVHSSSTTAAGTSPDLASCSVNSAKTSDSGVYLLKHIQYAVQHLLRGGKILLKVAGR